MDVAESMFIRKVFIKERGAKVLRKIRPSLIRWEPSKATAPPRTAVGYLEKIASGAQSSVSGLLFANIQLLASALWTNLESVSNGAMNSGNLLCPDVTAIDVNLVKYVIVADNIDNSDEHWAVWIIRGPGEDDMC